MYFSTPTLLNQQEIKIFNIVEFLAIIFLKKAWWFLSYKVRETQILSWWTRMNIMKTNEFLWSAPH